MQMRQAGMFVGSPVNKSGLRNVACMMRQWQHGRVSLSWIWSSGKICQWLHDVVKNIFVLSAQEDAACVMC